MAGWGRSRIGAQERDRADSGQEVGELEAGADCVRRDNRKGKSLGRGLGMQTQWTKAEGGSGITRRTVFGSGGFDMVLLIVQRVRWLAVGSRRG